MVKLVYQNTEIKFTNEETVLDALLRHGVEVPHSCTNGTCQSCMIRCERGHPSAEAQKGLKSTLVARNYFLACQCQISKLDNQGELHVSLDDQDDLFEEATLITRRMLAPQIAQLIFTLKQPMEFSPGQFVHTRHPSGLLRSYSIASGPNEKQYLELHIGRIENGCMSNYLIDELAVGSTTSIRGPSGNCFYVPGTPEQPMLLVGTGTGLAPLLGIVRAALVANHKGPLHLYHGSYTPDGLYLQTEMETLTRQHAQFHYYPCADNTSESKLHSSSLHHGRAADLALATHRDLSGWRVFLCGHPDMVKTTKKRSYLAGASLADIYTDPFEIGPKKSPN